jgi:hypothetical protein
VGPAFVALAHAELRGGDSAAAAAAVERGIGLRGMNQETHIGTWFLFEATDVATWLMESDPATGERVLPVLHALGSSLLADADRGGTPPALRVRHALREAAVAQGQYLRGDVRPDTDATFRAAAHALRQERRIFDAARVDLWRAEALGDEEARASARAVFHQLAAAPYHRRAGA